MQSQILLHNVFRVAVALIIIKTIFIVRVESEKAESKHVKTKSKTTKSPVVDDTPRPASTSESPSNAGLKSTTEPPEKLPDSKLPSTEEKPPKYKPRPRPKPDTKPKPNESGNKTLEIRNPRLYDPRELTYFLETHTAHSVLDPRAFFTEERASRSLSILVHYTRTVPYKVRLAFLLRLFSEFGRKIASRLSDYIAELNAIFKESSSSNESGVAGIAGRQRAQAALVSDAVNNVFNNKEDHEPKDIITDVESSVFMPITRRSKSDDKKSDESREQLFNSSIDEVSTRFSHMITYIVYSTCRFRRPPKATPSRKSSLLMIPKEGKDTLAWLISQALGSGARHFIMTLEGDEKFRVPTQVFQYLQLTLKKTSAVFKRHLIHNDFNLGKDFKFIQSQFHQSNAKEFEDLNPMSDKNSLIGPWSNYLFSNLANTERVVKLFCSLIRRVPNEAKTRWINIYKWQVVNEFSKTLPSFVIQLANQGSWPNLNKTDSTRYFLDKFANNRTNPKDEPQLKFADEKERLPARCYLAGRRWRALLWQALTKEYYGTENVLERFANKVAEIRKSLLANNAPLAGNLIRACLPMLEKALRGLSLSGAQQLDASSSSLNKVAALYSGTSQTDDRKLWDLALSDTTNLHSGRRSSGEPDLRDDPTARPGDDMFARAAKLGYWLGFKLGYNERRETDLPPVPDTHRDPISTVPIERQSASGTERGDARRKTLRPPYDDDLDKIKESSKDAWKSKREQARNHDMMLYLLATAVEVRAETEATKKAIAAAAHEVYAIIINELDVRAGYRNAAQVGKKFGALSGRSMGAEVGLQQSRIAAADWLARGDLFSSMLSSSSSSSASHSKPQDLMSWHERVRLAAEASGQSIGMRAGEFIGTYVGQEVAALAYERKLVDGSEDTWCGVGQRSSKLVMFYLSELEAGLRLGAELGTRMGSRVASSSAQDPSAPQRLPLPGISPEHKQRRGRNKGEDPFINKPVSASSPLPAVDDWEKELMVPLTAKGINKLHANAHEDSLLVSGTLRGRYKSRRVIKLSKEDNYERVALVEREHSLLVTARGYLLDSSTMYLELNGTIADDFESDSDAGPIFVGSVVSYNPFLSPVPVKG